MSVRTLESRYKRLALLVNKKMRPRTRYYLAYEGQTLPEQELASLSEHDTLIIRFIPREYGIELPAPGYQLCSSL